MRVWLLLTGRSVLNSYKGKGGALERDNLSY